MNLAALRKTDKLNGDLAAPRKTNKPHGNLAALQRTAATVRGAGASV